MEARLSLSEEGSYYSPAPRRPRQPRQQRALAVLLGLGVGLLAAWLATGLAPPAPAVALRVAPPSAQQSRTIPAMKATKTFVFGDGEAQRVIKAESWEEAEALAQKQLAIEESERRQAAQLYAVDLYDDHWDGDVYKGPAVNTLTVILGLAIGAPLLGLLVGYLTYGSMWGVSGLY